MLDVRLHPVNIALQGAQPRRARQQRTLALAVLLFGSTMAGNAPAATCSEPVDSPLARLELIAPLVAHLGPALKLSIGDDGCVIVERPPYYAQPGLSSFRLEAAELSVLKGELENLHASRFDAASIRSAIADQQRSGTDGALAFVVADGNMLHLSLREPDGRMHSLRWRNLEEDLLNHPHMEGLVLLGAIRDRLMDLANDARLEQSP